MFDLRARRFHQLAVLDARGASRLAGAAIQTLIDVFHERVAERQAALIHQHDLANSPARGIGFEAPEFVGRAMIQAQAAMNAVRVVFICGNIRAGKSASRRRAGWLLHASDLIGHEFIARLRNVPGPGYFADRTNVLRGASIQNPDAVGPRQRPRKFSASLDTTPAWRKRAFRPRRRREIPRRSPRRATGAAPHLPSVARTPPGEFRMPAREKQNRVRSARPVPAVFRAAEPSWRAAR